MATVDMSNASFDGDRPAEEFGYATALTRSHPNSEAFQLELLVEASFGWDRCSECLVPLVELRTSGEVVCVVCDPGEPWLLPSEVAEAEFLWQMEYNSHLPRCSECGTPEVNVADGYNARWAIWCPVCAPPIFRDGVLKCWHQRYASELTQEYARAYVVSIRDRVSFVEALLEGR